MDTKLGRYIVNGAHESAKLQDILDGFIKKFVLCPGCDNPETDLVSGGEEGRRGREGKGIALLISDQFVSKKSLPITVVGIDQRLW